MVDKVKGKLITSYVEAARGGVGKLGGKPGGVGLSSVLAES